MMRVGSLFSGAGLGDLGLTWAGFEHAWFCEINPYARQVLALRWPGVPIYEDVREISADVERPDVLVGGFPCQPFSTASAGRRKGKADDRYLWPEMLRVISILKPAWVCAENVVGINALALDEVVSDLAGVGYEVAPPLEIPSCAVGSDHRRARFWVLAHSNGHSESGRSVNGEVAKLPRNSSQPGGVGTQDGRSHWMDRLRCVGNGQDPRITYRIGIAIMTAERRAAAAGGGGEVGA